MQEVTPKPLRDTAWLANRLKLSVTTIERFRAKGSKLLPPAIRLGHSIRYDEDVVEAWLKREIAASNIDSAAMTAEPTTQPE